MANSTTGLAGLAAAAHARDVKMLELLSESDTGTLDEIEHDDHPDRPTPADAVATLMLAGALDKVPGLAMNLHRGVDVLVLEAPAATWVSPLAAAARRHVDDLIAAEAEAEAAEQGEEDSPVHRDRRGYADGRCLFLQVNDQDPGLSAHKSAIPSDRYVLDAIADGKGVVVIAAPGVMLPQILRADHRISVPWPSGELLATAAEAAFGTRPAAILPDVLVRLLLHDDLRFAHRSGEGADQWLERLRQLALGKQAALPTSTSADLDSLHGMDEAVAWGRDLAADLADYAAGTLSWDEVDKGCMLVGPPGTGKTSYVKKLAATVNLPLVVGSYGAWQSNGHQGHMLKAMGETFAQAKAAAPAILFIDEIDSMPEREKLEGRNREYMVQVVNRFLELLDGASREGVVVVAAGNSLNVDPALVRPGRLDRVIHIGYPDQAALAAILRQKLGGDHLAGVDLSGVAAAALGATGADVEYWVRNARRLARRRIGGRMVLQDLLDQLPSLSELPMHERRRVAVHEAGHAVAAALETPGRMKMAMLRQGGGGVLCDVSRLPTAEAIKAQVRVWLAGRAAEDLLLGSVSVGAGGPDHSDLAMATASVAAMIGSHGLDDGLAWWGDINPTTVAHILRQDRTLAARVDAILSDQYRQVHSLLHLNRPALEAVADHLLDRSTLTGDEIEEIVTSMAARREELS